MYRLAYSTAAILALSTMALAAPAVMATEPKPEVHSSQVDYSDLNLATKSGEQTVIKRIKTAAAKDCQPWPSGPDLDVYSRFDTCRKIATQNAISQIHNVQLTQLFDRETGAHL